MKRFLGFISSAVLLGVGLLCAMPGYAFADVTAPAKAGGKAGMSGTAGKGVMPRVITLNATDAMRFEPAAIDAKAGERLRVVLKPTSAMPKMAMAHNFVVLKAGAPEGPFVDASAAAAPTYIAPALKAQVLISTPIAGGGESVSADFTAPVKPGRYTFFCTFPGHFISGMKGVLVVK
jgi:azurin